MKFRSILCILILLYSSSVMAQQKHVFSFGQAQFLLDGKPFRIISGEMHPARIPKVYWRHRIRMAKAMGCNTIAAYVFWNYLETSPGHFDFSTENRDVAGFIRICQEEGMWVLLRPGPYVCAEWDFGGLPPYLLKIPDIRIRCNDPRYMKAVQRYISALSRQVKGLQCTEGGPILMVQIENEYGSYGNDKVYLEALRSLWQRNGIVVPFYTADGATPYMLDAGHIPGTAIGLDSGGNDGDFAQAAKADSLAPAFSSETYPGWLTHWSEKWARPDTADLRKEVEYLLQNKKSFNLYVIHGGTNFGFTAGANAFSNTQYQPDITSYDYDAPIDEQGRPTPKYFLLRDLITKYTGNQPMAVPAPVPVMEIPAIDMKLNNSIWNNLPAPVLSAQPLTMEALDQNQGLILYRTRLIGHKSGKLTIREPHDYALIFLDHKFIDTVYRDKGDWTVNLPADPSVKDPVLEILVEGMGHINFAQFMYDRKGITERVTLNGMTLMNWENYSLPMDGQWVQVHSGATRSLVPRIPGGYIFRGEFRLDNTADTYFDLSGYVKGTVYVNGHNLGRYWQVGPQLHLYCPAGWLKIGNNEIIVVELLQADAAPVKGMTTLE